MLLGHQIWLVGEPDDGPTSLLIRHYDRTLVLLMETVSLLGLLVDALCLQIIIIHFQTQSLDRVRVCRR